MNISGPVRAIRSYLGANSYLYTVNTHLFYPDREDLVTDVRGHAGLPGYGSADDYMTGTTGLTYSDPVNTGVADRRHRRRRHADRLHDRVRGAGGVADGRPARRARSSRCARSTPTSPAST